MCRRTDETARIAVSLKKFQNTIDLLKLYDTMNLQIRNKED